MNAATLGDWKKDKTSCTVIQIQINNQYISIHSGAFYFGGINFENTFNKTLVFK